MSESTDVHFAIYHGGTFEAVGGITSAYKGGEYLDLVSSPEMLLINISGALGISLYNQRVWYKLPFEDLTELKMMCSGDAMFQKMVQSTIWTKAADIFLEKDIDDGGSGNGDEALGNGDEAPENEDRDGASDNGDGASDNGDEASDNGAGDGDEMLEEDAQVERNVAGFVDEDEHYNSEATPQNSDGEDDGPKYDRYKQGSGELKLGQAFDSIAEFKEAVIDYSLKSECNVRFSRWGKEKSEVKCAIVADKDKGVPDDENVVDGDETDATGALQPESPVDDSAALKKKKKKKVTDCEFRIYCSFENSAGKYLIKTFNDVHSCIPDGCSKVIKGRNIAKLFLNEIRRDPTMKPKAMQAALEEKHNLIVTNDQCRKARKIALSMIQDEQDEQFSRLKDYKTEILRTNPDSTVEVATITNSSGLETFDKVYVCFAALKRTWVAHCRPIFGIDGCFLKNNVKGQLLAAVGRDANNQFFPVAWAVVQVENTDNWLWFIKTLKHDLGLKNGEGFTLISDRQKGLLNAVDQELPKIEHRMCARHIYGNLRRVYRGKDLPKDLFWRIAKSYNIGEYERALKALKDFNVDVYESLMTRNPHHCSRAFFSCNPVCEDVSNNFSESYNNTINKAREMPLVEMLETIRRQNMIRMDIRKKKAFRWKAKYTEKVVNTIKEEKNKSKHSPVIPSGNGIYEVVENNQGYTVDIKAKTCACRRWGMTGIPCRHALKVISKRKGDPLNYVSDRYLTTILRKQYMDPVRPVNGINFWRRSLQTTIQPPPREDRLPTKEEKKRKKGKNESPQKKKKKGKGMSEPQEKVTKLAIVGRILYCGRCGLQGHNTKKCNQQGCTFPWSNRRPAHHSEGESSQQSQPSQSSQMN